MTTPLTDAEIENIARSIPHEAAWRAIRQLQGDVAERVREIGVLREAYMTLNFNHKAAKSDHASLVTKLTAENAANDRLVTSMSEDYRGTIEGLREDVAKRDATIADLRADIARLELAANAWRSE